MRQIDLIIIGNEILLGMVLDTNSQYLCRAVRGFGRRVGHISAVADDLGAIAAEIKNSVDRGAELIITCGGLGPTADDLTLEGIARATSRALETDLRALQLVTDRYRELAASGFVKAAEMDEARLKMARLPAGAVAVDNPVGAAPAIALDFDAMLIVALPGVPREMKAIVEGPLQPMLAERLGSGGYCELELIADCGDESVLAPLLKSVAADHPEAYVKSRAREFGATVKFLITISAAGASPEQAKSFAESARKQLEKALALENIPIQTAD
jgi:molybdenum cofactor synthesis domain-containing protein